MKKYFKSEVFDYDMDFHIQYMSSANEKIHMHDFFEFVYVLEGNLYNEVDGKSYFLTPGSLVFIGYDQTHKIYGDTKVAYVNILFNSNFLYSDGVNTFDFLNLFSLLTLHNIELDKENLLPIIKFKGEEKELFDNMVYSMLSEYNSGGKYFNKVIYHELYVFLLRIVRHLEEGSNIENEGKLQSNFIEVIQYVRNNFKDVSLESLSKKFFYSTSYMSKMFKIVSGTTFKEYIQREKIQKALNLIEETDYSFEKISEELGYADKKDFYTMFKKRTGMTPGQMRKKMKASDYKNNKKIKGEAYEQEK